MLYEKIIEEYLNTPENERSLTKLSKKYDISRKMLTKKFREQNIEIINYQNRCRIDEHMFDTIDSEEKAYWLGFLYADGSLNSKEKKLELNLSVKDLDHMQKFKEFLKSTSSIRTSICKTNKGIFEMCRFSVRNANLYEQLNLKGCIPNKTLILKFPEKSIFLYDKLIYDFLRGYVDGDGTLGLYKNSNNSRSFNLKLAGTLDFLCAAEMFLGIKGCIRNPSYKDYSTKIFVLSYNGRKARKVARLLYENSTIHLTRKFNIYKEFCRAEEESSVLQSSKIGESCDANTEVCSEITKGSERL